MPPKTDVQDILLENDFLTSQNANYRSYCQDINDYCLPRKAWIDSIRVKGERIKFNFLYDSTAIGGIRDSAAGIQTYLNNPTSRWFEIVFRDKQLMARTHIKAFCSDVAEWSLAKLNDSNFYNINLEWNTDLLSCGTGTYGMFVDDRRFLKFKEIPVGQVNRVVDEYGNLVAIYINFKLTARQAVKEFGNNVGEAIRKSIEDKKPFEEFDFLHYVGERHEREAGKADSGNMPFKSCWIAKKDKHLIRESGFMEMPYISQVFYHAPNDANGFSPAMDIFPEIKLVNAMSRTFIRADMKQSDPPMVLPSRGFVLPLNLNPAATNYRDAKSTTKDDIQYLVPPGRLNTTKEHIEMIQERIRERLFVNLFRSLNEITKQMTIYEVQQRINQAMSLLSPVIFRFTGSHGLMIKRLINMGIRDPSSDFPEIPEEVMDQTYDLVYLSPLAKAQKHSEITDIQSFLSDVQAIGQVIPSALDKIDEDKTVDVLHRIRGVTPDILRDEEAVERIRQHRAEQEQMLAALQAGGAAAQIAKTGADAQKSMATAGVQ